MRALLAFWLPPVALCVAGCGGPPVDSAPTFKVKVDGPFVAGVNDVLNLSITLSNRERSASMVSLTGEAIQKIGADLNTGKSPVKGEFRAINLTVLAPLAPEDAAVGHKILHLSYDTRDLQRAVHFGADTDTLLVAAKEVGWWTPANDDVIDAYCREHEAGRFCTGIKQD